MPIGPCTKPRPPAETARSSPRCHRRGPRISRPAPSLARFAFPLLVLLVDRETDGRQAHGEGRAHGVATPFDDATHVRHERLHQVEPEPGATARSICTAP